MLISEIYRPKPLTVLPTTPLHQVVELLNKHNVNALVVINEQKTVVGVISLQDIASATIPRQFRNNLSMAAAMYRRGFFTDMCQSIRNLPVKDVMRKEAVQVSLHDNIMAVTADFLKNDLYVVPVVDHGVLVGVVTRTELKKALLYGMRDVKNQSNAKIKDAAL